MAETQPHATPVNPRDLRVSDAEREHIVGLLQKAIGRGLIDLNEFTERTDIAYAATTRGELTIALADLPGLVHPDAPRPGATATRSGPIGDRLELTAHYSTLARTGNWVVPERVVVSNSYGNTKLDFTDAEIATPVVYLELNCRWGSVDITIPYHAAVDLNAITEVKYASLDDKTRSNGRSGSPLIVLSGRVHGGSLKIRHPRRRGRCC
ncbi:MAG: DUF1707 SHOCT-like domain-containing protein [Pseudonocardiaceae bacterium]